MVDNVVLDIASNVNGKLDATGKKVVDNLTGSIDVKGLINDFTSIDSSLTSMKSSFEDLNKLEVKDLNKLTSRNFMMNTPIGNLFSQKHGKLTQIYHSANNERTIQVIDEIKKYIVSLIEWLRKVSAITDSTKLAEYFSTKKDDATGNHIGFVKSFFEFSARIDEINTIVGNTTKTDDILIQRVNLLTHSYERIANLLEEANKGVCISTPIKELYVESITNHCVGVLQNSDNMRGQNVTLVGYAFFNEFFIKNVYPVIQRSMSEFRRKEFFDALFREIFFLLSQNEVKSIDEVKVLFKSGCEKVIKEKYKTDFSILKNGTKLKDPDSTNLGDLIYNDNLDLDFLINETITLKVGGDEKKIFFHLIDLKAM